MTAKTDQPGGQVDSIEKAAGESQEPQTDAAPGAMDVASEETVAAVEDERVDLESAQANAEQELAEYQDAMLRMQAEMENLRKRLIRELERSRRRVLELFMTDLLPVRDSLERGLEAADETATVESLKEGKALIIKMLNKVMKDHGLTVIDPAGQPFDPELHEAISMQPSEEHEANTVMEVVQKGFQLNERLIRPARVVVSRGTETD